MILGSQSLPVDSFIRHTDIVFAAESLMRHTILVNRVYAAPKWPEIN